MPNVKPLVLVDDIMVVVTGNGAYKRFVKALDATHEYLLALGAKVAPEKSYNFASDGNDRRGSIR